MPSLGSGAATAVAITRQAVAQSYPSRPIHLIVPFAPAGASDIIARIIAPPLSERLGQQIVIENRPGAAGNIGTEAVARASPDGYTLLLVGPTNTINATLYAKPNFDFLRDIVPVAGISREASVIVVHPSFPVKFLVTFLIVITIGGSNGIIGALFGSLLLGVLDAAGKYYAPSIGAFIIYGVMVVTLIVRPQGLFARADAR